MRAVQAVLLSADAVIRAGPDKDGVKVLIVGRGTNGVNQFGPMGTVCRCTRLSPMAGSVAWLGATAERGGYPVFMSSARVVREDDVERATWSDPVRGEVGFRTLFGADVRTPDFTVGVTELEVGGWLGHHRHEPSEIYYVLSGEGTLSIDGKDHPVRTRTAAYIPSNSEHGIRNTGNEQLRFFYVFAVGSFEEIEYSFTAEQ